MKALDIAAVASPEVMGEALRAAGWRTDEALPELDRVWPAARGGLCLLYRGRGRDSGRLWGVVAGDPEPHPALSEAVRKGCSLFLPRLDAYVVSFENDPRLRRLDRLLSRSAAARRLSHWLPAEGVLGEPRLIRYKPLYRCVVSYSVHLDGNGREVTLLVKRVPRHAIETVRAVYSELASVFPALRVARPVGFVEEWNALVWKAWGSSTLRQRILEGFGVPTVVAAAGALAEFHGSSALFVKCHSRDRELRGLSTWAASAQAARPEVVAGLAELVDALEAGARELRVGCLRPAHRDFHDEQVLVAGADVRMIDFDTAACCEPELDVGNFLAHLELHRATGRLSAGQGLGAAFLEGYRRRGGALDLDRLSWYTVAALARLACVYAFREGERRAVPSLLDRAWSLCDSRRNELEVG